jgi:hypothetical protein
MMWLRYADALLDMNCCAQYLAYLISISNHLIWSMSECVLKTAVVPFKLSILRTLRQVNGGIDFNGWWIIVTLVNHIDPALS